MNILFWNTYKNNAKGNIDKCLIDFIFEKQCDIIVLAEYEDNVKSICDMINSLCKEEYIPIPNYGGCERIKGIINKKYKTESINEQSRYQIIKIQTTSYKLLVGMIHNISKLRNSEEEQKEILRLFHNDICKEEENHKTKNTLVIGDFNSNPFEASCISASIMHAIPYAEEVKKTTRIIQNQVYHKFYNPMWKLFGRCEEPYATYYYNNSKMINYYWNMFDQVIFRPELINSFIDDSLTIVTNTKNHDLLNGNKPNKKYYSDHLPIYCTLKEENIK